MKDYNATAIEAGPLPTIMPFMGCSRIYYLAAENKTVYFYKRNGVHFHEEVIARFDRVCKCLNLGITLGPLLWHRAESGLGQAQ